MPMSGSIKMLCLIILGVFPVWLYAQSADSVIALSGKLQDKYLGTISKKSEKAIEGLDKQTEKYLDKLERQERKIQKKLAKIDSVAAKNIFTDADKKYQQLRNQLKTKAETTTKRVGQYLPWLDSASTSLKYLDNNPLVKGIGANSAKVKGALSQVRALESQFKQAANVKDFIKQRKEYLKERLQRYDLGKELKNYNKTAYYYSQQINEYREALNNPEKAERKVLELLNRLPAFQSFMKKNSLLASLFAIPGGADADPNMLQQSLAGLQTRASVQELIQGRIAAGGPNAQAMLQQNIDAAQAELSSLKTKLQQLGNGSKGSGPDDLPDFKPNNQKTKPFLKRLEYGTNIQTIRSGSYFPATSDIALSVGYKLTDKSILGIGASYKMGWGQDIRHIQISGQGVGLRSFVDMKLKGSFYASGGFEYNYQQPFASVEQLPYLNAWQKSGLVGVSKIINIKTKFFKKTKVQLLWDFLSYQQVPQTQPLKFRIGYNF